MRKVRVLPFEGYVTCRSARHAQVSDRILFAHSQAPLALTSLESKLEANMLEEEVN